MLADLAAQINQSNKIASVPSGDAQRTWFPEMIDVLRKQWRRDMSLDALFSLCIDLDAILQRIRFERNIRSLIVKCVKCGHLGESAEVHVSVRAMLLSVIRFEIDSSGPTKAAEKRWDAHRRANGLDIYGRVAESTPIKDCSHSNP